MPERRIDKRVTLLGRDVHITKRASTDRMGRFGGGWQFKIGVMWAPRSDVIVSLLVMDVRISKAGKWRRAPR